VRALACRRAKVAPPPIETENLANKKVGVCEKLLEMQNRENVVPVLLAAANGYKELATYLYSKTPSNVFDGTNSQNRVLLLSLCITAEIFGKKILSYYLCRFDWDF